MFKTVIDFISYNDVNGSKDEQQNQLLKKNIFFKFTIKVTV